MHNSNKEDDEAYEAFLKDSGLSKRQIKQFLELEQTLRELNEDFDEED